MVESACVLLSGNHESSRKNTPAPGGAHPVRYKSFPIVRFVSFRSGKLPPLEDLGDDLVGPQVLRAAIILVELGDDPLDVVVGDLLAKDADVLEEILDALDGRLVIGGYPVVAGGAAADHFLLEAGRDFLLVAVVVVVVVIVAKKREPRQGKRGCERTGFPGKAFAGSIDRESHERKMGAEVPVLAADRSIAVPGFCCNELTFRLGIARGRLSIVQRLPDPGRKGSVFR